MCHCFVSNCNGSLFLYPPRELNLRSMSSEGHFSGALMIALMALPRKSIIPNGSECAGVPWRRLLQQLRRRPRLVGGCLVHFNKANELPVSISFQRLRSLPGILFI